MTFTFVHVGIWQLQTRWPPSVPALPHYLAFPSCHRASVNHAFDALTCYGLKIIALPSVTLRCFRRPRQIASAKDVQDPFSSVAANRRISVHRGRTRGAKPRRVLAFPSGKVPVLSDNQRINFGKSVRGFRVLYKAHPIVRHGPSPVMIDHGVASPNAHGQAIINTATADTSA